MLAGRDFDERDAFGKPNVVILSRSTARKLFGDEDPIGRQLLMSSQNTLETPTEIIGVVGDVRSQQLAQQTEIEFYRPWGQRPFAFVTVAVRTATKPEATLGIVRAALNRVDKSLPIIQPNTMEAIIADSLGQQRLTMSLLGGFAAIALILAVVGIYGAVAYTVEQRTGEIGVRMALGARTTDVLRMVIRQGMTPVVIGLAIGLAATFAVGRLLATQLYQISPHNPLLLSLTAALLIAVALLACLIPARRASLVNPIEALRTE
jgi:predicted permease